MNKIKLIKSSALGTVVTIIFVVVITVWAEFSAPLKNWLAGFSGHHWTSKSIFSVVIYALATLGFYGISKDPEYAAVRKSLNLLLVVSLLGAVTLVSFFSGHHLGIF